jgi:hypothetical protein
MSLDGNTTGAAAVVGEFEGSTHFKPCEGGAGCDAGNSWDKDDKRICAEPGSALFSAATLSLGDEGLLRRMSVGAPHGHA